jgi:hypothetical protein
MVIPLCICIPSIRIAPAITISQKPDNKPKIGFNRYRLLTNMIRKMKSISRNTKSNIGICNA